MSSQELTKLLRNELYLGVPQSQDFGDVIGLFAMICKLTQALKQKKPGMTHYQVIRLCTKDTITDDTLIERLAILCEFLSIGCSKFPDLGVPVKEMPSKIKDLISKIAPF